MKNIEWHTTNNLTLVAQRPGLGLSEPDIDPIQEWCEANRCGLRTSFDTFRFKSERDKNLFLLKWSGNDR